MTGIDVANQAKRYIGVPFVHQGRTNRGLDCVGLVVAVARDLRLSSYDYKEYKRTPNPQIFMEICRGCKDWSRIPVGSLDVGDVIVMAFAGAPVHLAIVTPGPNIVHALSLREKVCEHRLSNEWQRKIKACFRFKEIEQWRN